MIGFMTKMFCHLSNADQHRDGVTNEGVMKRRVAQWVAACLCLMVLAAPAWANPQKPYSPPLVRVGVFDNRPIVFTLNNGRQAGIAIDVLEYVARQEGWTLKYVVAPWAELLSKLDDGSIDLVVGIAYTEERAQRYNFTRESLVGNWGIVYKRPELRIMSPLDLEDRRVAMLRGGTHSIAFLQLLRQFGVNATAIETSSYAEAMELTTQGKADAAVVNRTFATLNAHRYRLAETGIIFNPIYVHYAAPRTADRKLLDALDRHLMVLKSDKSSIYYESLARWLESVPRQQLPAWLWGSLAVLAGVLLVSLMMALLLRYQVRLKTGELRHKSEQLEQEVVQRREAQGSLNQLAFFDSLTGLPNRAAFPERFAQDVLEAQQNGHKLALLFVDVDRLKTINDSLGHGMGDILIQRVGERLQACLRDHDHISRFGGDEYAIIATRINTQADIGRVADRMLASLAGPIDLSGTQVYASASIGIAVYPDHDQSLDGLLRDADAAMYRAKSQGGNRYEFYQPQHTALVTERFRLENRLRQALDAGELSLAYQPVVSLDDQHIVGVEAFLRWHDAEHGDVPPDQFIPMAEDTGLILPIGDWVLTEACRQARAWQQAGMAPLRMSVNVSSRQIQLGRIMAGVERALSTSGLDANLLELEITEGALLVLTDDVRHTLKRLGDMGIRLALDDFGTGYSSLSYLQKLPFDVLKIDRSFVRNIPDQPGDVQIAATIRAMARGLGMQVVAEGIETEAQLACLRGLECEFGQGFLISRPLTATDLAAWVRRQTPAAVGRQGEPE